MKTANRIRRCLIASLFAVVGWNASAVTYYQCIYGSGYDENNPATWKDAEGNPCSVLTSSDELISEGYRLFWGNTSRELIADSLTIGGETKSSVVYEKFSGGKTIAMRTYVIPSGRTGFVLRNGFLSLGQDVGHGQHLGIDGRISVDQPAGVDTFGLCFACDYDVLIRLSGELSSTAESVLEIGKAYPQGSKVAGLDVHQYLQHKGQSGSNAVVEVSSDCSSFLGTMSVTNRMQFLTSDAKGKMATWGTRMVFADGVAIGGSLNMAAGCVLAVADANSSMAVKNLTLASGSALELPSAGAEDLDANGFVVRVLGKDKAFFTVEGSLAVNGKALVWANGLEFVPNGETNVHRIISFPAACDVSAEDFELVGPGVTYVPTKFRVVEFEAGVKTLCLVVEPFQRLAISDTDDGVTAVVDNQVYSSAFTNAAAWSDGKLPRAGVVSLAVRPPKKTSGQVFIRTPDGRMSSSYTNEFNGARLVIGPEVCFIPNCRAFVSRHEPLTFLDGSWMKCPNINSKIDFIGGVEVRSGLVRWMPYPRTTFRVDKLTGSAEFSIAATDFTWANMGAHHYMDMSGFYGRITCVQPRSGYSAWGDLDPKTGLPQYYQQLFIENNSLGGPLETFERAALRIGTWAHLFVGEGQSSSTLSADDNRGLTVDGFVYAKPGRAQRMRIDWPITMNGTFILDDIGVLALGGCRTMFGPEAAALPQSAWTNDLQVRRGTLELCSANAVDGMTISVSNAATVRIAYDAKDADMVKYGVKTGKTLRPFVLDAGLNGKLPLELDLSAFDGVESGSFSFGLLSVANDPSTVAEVEAMLPTLGKTRVGGHRYAMKMRKAVSDDGTLVTFAVDAEIQGLMLIFR